MTTEEEHYSLRWNNHQNHILRAFDSLLQTKTLVDVTLVCAETSIRAHKVVLSACSPFFQRVFSETPCKHPVIVLKDFRGWVVQAIVDFMYRGEISVPQQRLQALIQAGESLQVRGLVDHPVTGKTPTPAASPDDFAMMDTSIVSPESPPQSSFEDHPAMMGAKLMLPTHHMYMNSSAASVAGAELCTSPMPRRKQARPRRRSGECGPHDLTSKSPTPKRSTSPTDCARTTADGDEVIHHDDEMMMHEADDKENKPEPNLIDDEDADEDDEECKEIKSVTARKDNEDEDDVGGGGDGVGDVDEDDDDGHDEEDIEERDEEGEEGASGEGPEDLCTKNSLINNNNSDSLRNNNNNNNNNTTSSSNNNNNNSSSNNNNNNRIVLSLKDIRHLNRPPTMGRNVPIPPPHLAGPNGSAISPLDFHHHHQQQQQQQQQHQQHMQQQHQHHQNSSKDHHALMQSAAEHMKREAMENHARMETSSPNFLEQMDLSMPHHMHHPHHPHHPHMPSLHDLENRGMHKDFPSSPMSLPSHFNPPDGPPHPPSPLPFPGMSSALTLTPPHMFGLDSPLGLFPPGMDPGKLYNPLMDMSDPRGMHSEHHSPYMKKKMSRPKGQHSAPRGGPPRSWTNAELTEALQHVWNKKMTTSQASRIFGIPYNSLLMYVRGKYGKSLKLEQLRKDCISGPPIELLTMGLAASKAHLSESRKNSSNNDMKDMDGGPQMQRSSSSEPDLMSSPNPMFNPFPHGFYPDFPGGFPGLPLSMLSLMPPERHPPPMHLNSSLDEDCKSDRSKQSLEDEFTQPLALNREERRELMQQNGGGGGGGQD